jgi:threonine dehydrogenase-like Zn-dependent dehydrogenase
MTVNWSPFVVDEMTIIGSRCGPFDPALHLLEHDQVDPTDLIAAKFSLDKAPGAFREAGKAGMLKVLLEP